MGLPMPSEVWIGAPGHTCVPTWVGSSLGSLEIRGVEGVFPFPSRAQACRETPAGLTPPPPTDVIHTVGPIAHGDPSTTQATELRSCYLNSLDLLLEHRLRSAVRGPGRGGLVPEETVPQEAEGGGEAETDAVPLPSPLHPRPGVPLHLNRRVR